MGINGISAGYYEGRYINVKNKAAEAGGEAIGSSTDRNGTVRQESALCKTGGD